MSMSLRLLCIYATNDLRNIGEINSITRHQFNAHNRFSKWFSCLRLTSPRKYYCNEQNPISHKDQSSWTNALSWDISGIKRQPADATINEGFRGNIFFSDYNRGWHFCIKISRLYAHRLVDAVNLLERWYWKHNRCNDDTPPHYVCFQRGKTPFC